MTRADDAREALARLDAEVATILNDYCAAITGEKSALGEARLAEAFAAANTHALRGSGPVYQQELRVRLAENRTKLVEAQSKLHACQQAAKQRMDRLAAIEAEIVSWSKHLAAEPAEGEAR